MLVGWPLELGLTNESVSPIPQGHLCSAVAAEALVFSPPQHQQLSSSTTPAWQLGFNTRSLGDQPDKDLYVCGTATGGSGDGGDRPASRTWRNRDREARWNFSN